MPRHPLYMVAVFLLLAAMLVLLSFAVSCARPIVDTGLRCVPRDTSDARRVLDDDSGDHGTIVYPGDTCFGAIVPLSRRSH